MSACRLSILLTLLCLAGCDQPAKGPEGIVLVIADGTSRELLTAARIYGPGVTGSLALDGLKHSAFVRTYSASHLVTDSGAAATAMARGVKADNRVVGQAGVNDQSAPPSILDLAKKAGWSTAVISDDAVIGATPAAFLVEHPRREQSVAIAAKMVPQMGLRADIVLGGGSKWFSDRGNDGLYQTGDHEIVRETQRLLAASPVRFFDSWDEFKKQTTEKPDSHPVLGVFYPDVFPFYADGERTLRLKDMVAEAVRILRARERPFLLVVEAGLPDKAAHLNNAKRAMVEVFECDEVVAWIRQHLGPKVLLLVTTDHNTGGLALNGYPPLAYKGDALLQQNPLTGNSILTWASGPGYDQGRANTRIKVVQEPGQPLRESKEQKRSTDFDYVQPALVEADSALHEGGDVWLLADGPGAEKVRGSMDNTEIYRVMADAISGSSGKR